MTSPSEVVDANASTEEAAEETEKARVEDVLGRLIERGYKFVHPRDAALVRQLNLPAVKCQ